MTVTVDIEDLPSLVGRTLGPSGWVDVAQKRINLFADATDDHQWIHTDPERAKAGPFGMAIAHGYLTLSLAIPMWSELLNVRDAATKVNYGLGKVRFPAPAPAGSKIRLHATIDAVTPLDPGAQITVAARIDSDAGDKPVCAAELVFRFYP